MGVRHEGVTPFDPGTPSIARVWDYWLGGKDNFAADRELAEKMLRINPLAAQMARENAGAARDVATTFTRAIAPGSYVIISVGTGQAEVAEPFSAAYTAAPLYIHAPGEVMTYFDGLELVPPGLVPARGWEAGGPPPKLAPRRATFLAGAGLKPRSR